jgi:hypothetical protein
MMAHMMILTRPYLYFYNPTLTLCVSLTYLSFISSRNLPYTAANLNVAIVIASVPGATTWKNRWTRNVKVGGLGTTKVTTISVTSEAGVQSPVMTVQLVVAQSPLTTWSTTIAIPGRANIILNSATATVWSGYLNLTGAEAGKTAAMTFQLGAAMWLNEGQSLRRLSHS